MPCLLQDTGDLKTNKAGASIVDAQSEGGKLSQLGLVANDQNPSSRWTETKGNVQARASCRYSSSSLPTSSFTLCGGSIFMQ